MSLGSEHTSVWPGEQEHLWRLPQDSRSLTAVRPLLVPLVKTLQAELGEERAHAIVRKALGDLYRQFGAQWWRAQGAWNLGDNMAATFDTFAAGEALDYEVVKQTPDAFEVNVTGCR
jgi:hypothetical protein